jgi:hypothetical protein
MNTICRKLLFFLLNFTVVLFSFGQKNIQPGYIITLSKDTVKGFIDYRNWEKNPHSIAFSANQLAKPIYYSPNEIKVFEVGNELYVSANVKMDDSPFKVEDLSIDMKYNYIQDTVFLLNLVQGEKSLYFFKDSKSKEHFFIENNHDFDLLIYKRSLKYDYLGSRYMYEDKRYLGQLDIFLHDCASLQGKLRNTIYERKSLVTLFNYYYKCTNKQPRKENKAISKPYEMGVFGGMSSTQLMYLDGPAYLSKVDFSKSNNLTGGFIFDLVFPRHFGNVSITNEVQLLSFKSKANYDDPYLHTNVEIGLKYLQMNNMLRYKYPIKKAFLYLNAGVSVGIAFSKTNYIKKVTPFQPTSEGMVLEGLEKNYLGIPVGIGVRYHKYALECRYLSGVKKQDDINPASHPYSKTNSLMLLMSYHF